MSRCRQSREDRHRGKNRTQFTPNYPHNTWTRVFVQKHNVRSCLEGVISIFIAKHNIYIFSVINYDRNMFSFACKI